MPTLNFGSCNGSRKLNSNPLSTFADERMLRFEHQTLIDKRVFLCPLVLIVNIKCKIPVHIYEHVICK